MTLKALQALLSPFGRTEPITYGNGMKRKFEKGKRKFQNRLKKAIVSTGEEWKNGSEFLRLAVLQIEASPSLYRL